MNIEEGRSAAIDHDRRHGVRLSNASTHGCKVLRRSAAVLEKRFPILSLGGMILLYCPLDSVCLLDLGVGRQDCRFSCHVRGDLGSALHNIG
jgi:hypothetical protein